MEAGNGVLRVACCIIRVRARRHLCAIGKAVPIGIGVQGIGIMEEHLRPIRQPVAIRVRVEQIGAVPVLCAVAQPVAIEVYGGVSPVQGVQLQRDLHAIAQPVAVGIRIGSVGVILVRLLIVGEEVPIRIDAEFEEKTVVNPGIIGISSNVDISISVHRDPVTLLIGTGSSPRLRPLDHTL